MNILLLGGVGAGKSCALTILKNRYGAKVYQADMLVHELYKKGNTGYQALEKLFGTMILDDMGEIDRKKLGNILYKDADMLERVSTIIHPMVYEEMKNLILENIHGRLLVIEQALLPSADVDFFDEIWYLHADEDVRIQRLMESRGYSLARCKEIIEKQPHEDAYLTIATHVLNNTGDIESLQKQIRAILGENIHEIR